MPVSISALPAIVSERRRSMSIWMSCVSRIEISSSFLDRSFFRYRRWTHYRSTTRLWTCRCARSWIVVQTFVFDRCQSHRCSEDPLVQGWYWNSLVRRWWCFVGSAIARQCHFVDWQICSSRWCRRIHVWSGECHGQQPCHLALVGAMWVFVRFHCFFSMSCFRCAGNRSNWSKTKQSSGGCRSIPHGSTSLFHLWDTPADSALDEGERTGQSRFCEESIDSCRETNGDLCGDRQTCIEKDHRERSWSFQGSPC